MRRTPATSLRAAPIRRRPVVAALGAALIGSLLGILPTATATAATNDGTSQENAAASCWEIKQVTPNAPSGVYWLQTPKLQAPEQFYCDQTTDGGGWVLIGRGREDWTYDYGGRGTPAEVANPVTGPSAFVPKQLPATTVDGLVNGQRIDSMADGVRVRRATNAAGTEWQEVRFSFVSRDRWSWATAAGHPLSTWQVGSRTGAAASRKTTRDFGATEGLERVWTYDRQVNGWVRGWNYGANVTGTTAANSHLYVSTANGGYATPFAQVYIRPRLRTSQLTYPNVPDAGTPKQEQQALAKNGALPGEWGVTGLGAGGTVETAAEVQAFAQRGNVIYVGGNFTHVQKGANATGSNKVAQPYLAAFNATTGAWISTFRPTFNHQVRALHVLPNGSLMVGGEFTQVNGSPRVGIVVLNPTTGNTISTRWNNITIERRSATPSPVLVRAIDGDEDNIYIGGVFTHISAPGAPAVYARNMGRVTISGIVVDRNWNPEFNGGVMDIDLDDDGSRVYVAGYFTESGSMTADRGAAVSTAPGAALVTPHWQPTFSTATTARYQQAVAQVGNRVWLGGSQHSMFAYNRNSFSLMNTHITRTGGDIQAITSGSGIVYAGCHCDGWNYSNTSVYDNLNAGDYNVQWNQADSINFVGAWDASTGDYVPSFTPRWKARESNGAWALFVADDGTLWAGGTFTSAVRENGANQWVGGFARFAPRDSTAPARPGGLKATVSGGTADLSWSAVADAKTYEVIRDNRVVALTTTPSAQIPGSGTGSRFFVRAVDAAGNRSASTAVEKPTAVNALIANGSTWSYWVSDQAVDSRWGDASWNAPSWPSGTAPLGWGHSSIATNVDVAAGQTRPLTQYYRRTFDVTDPAAYGNLTLTTRADDGILVRLNGVEVARGNMPSGDIGPNTYALAPAPSTDTALANPVVVTVPWSRLVKGRNIVTVEVHSNWRATPNSSMDLSLTAGSVAPLSATTLVAEKSTWRYRVEEGFTPPTNWNKAGASNTGWGSGVAPLGWGHSSVKTDVDVAEGQTRPLAQYYRRTFTVNDYASLRGVRLRTWADDGIVVYLNGVEVGRKNMPNGPVDPNTYALTGVSTVNAMADPFVLDLPPSVLNAGGNAIAVEVHSNYRATPNSTMAVTLEGLY